ncbi:MAG: cytochrome b/b6 domain-containing protein [Candidatus Eremiobacteraeota bacterium]|nr:cytochrome b/b6 domain-containing protein [Candidatus Eremiobacteraeota bacterium]
MNVCRAIYKYAVATRVSHWLWVLAFGALVSSGLQIFNAAPFLDAFDRRDQSHRVLSIDSPQDGVGTTTLFGHVFTTTTWLGWTPNGMGGYASRAFPSWITIPSFQDLADGRRWHFFFAWTALVAWLTWLISSAVKGNLRHILLAPSDIPKLWPMQAYYLHLRKAPPPYGLYNPLQKASYTAVLFGLAPLVVLTGLSLSPGIDTIAHPLTWILGGRQFARLWHFTGMILLVGFWLIHVFQVLTQGVINQLMSMITGWYRPEEYQTVPVEHR